MMMTEEEARMMRHALGYGHPKMKPGWRNRYVVGSGAPAHDVWEGLVAKGFADDGGELNGGSRFFYVTDAGQKALAGKPE